MQEEWRKCKSGRRHAQKLWLGENLQSAESARQVSAGIGSYLAGLEAKQKDSATVYSRFPS